METCINCNNFVIENFCSKCGNPNKIKKIDFHYIVHEFQHLLHFEKGFHFTTWQMLIKPGKTIRTYLFENRNKFVKPIAYLFFASLIFSIIISFLFKGNIGILNVSRISPLKNYVDLKVIDYWLSSHIAYNIIIVGFFTAPWLVLFSRKRKYNIFEMLVVMSYVLATGLLVMVPLFILDKYLKVFGDLILIFILFQTWSIGQFFGEKNFLNYLKSFFALILGALTHVAFFFFIGYINKYYL